MRIIFAVITTLLLGLGPAMAQREIPAESVLVLEIETGRVFIEMFPDIAPRHVDQIRTLANQGFYDGVVFHRVIPGFMAQGGDPTGTGEGGSELPDLQAEFSGIPHQKGVVSMARTSDPNSANSQFFIMLEDTAPNGGPWSQLDSNYTVWGRVISGIEAVDEISRGEPPEDPTTILRARTVNVDFPEVPTFAGPPDLPGRATFAALTAGADDFDPLFEDDVQIDILTPVLAPRQN